LAPQLSQLHRSPLLATPTCKHAQIAPRAVALRRPAAPQMRALSAFSMPDQRPFAARPLARDLMTSAAAADAATTEETFQYQAEVGAVAACMVLIRGYAFNKRCACSSWPADCEQRMFFAVAKGEAVRFKLLLEEGAAATIPAHWHVSADDVGFQSCGHSCKQAILPHGGAMAMWWRDTCGRTILEPGSPSAHAPRRCWACCPAT
jgi:hypothetical protein